MIKGILTKEDALLAIKHKVNGIVVSNHSGKSTFLAQSINSQQALSDSKDRMTSQNFLKIGLSYKTVILSNFMKKSGLK